MSADILISDHNNTNLHCWIYLMTKQVRESLHRKLQGAFASHQDRPLDGAFLFASDEGANSCSCGVTDASIDCLSKHLDLCGMGQAGRSNAECGCASLRDNKISVTEILAKSL